MVTEHVCKDNVHIQSNCVLKMWLIISKPCKVCIVVVSPVPVYLPPYCTDMRRIYKKTCLHVCTIYILTVDGAQYNYQQDIS